MSFAASPSPVNPLAFSRMIVAEFGGFKMATDFMYCWTGQTPSNPWAGQAQDAQEAKIKLRETLIQARDSAWTYFTAWLPGFLASS